MRLDWSADRVCARDGLVQQNTAIWSVPGGRRKLGAHVGMGRVRCIDAGQYLANCWCKGATGEGHLVAGSGHRFRLSGGSSDGDVLCNDWMGPGSLSLRALGSAFRRPMGKRGVAFAVVGQGRGNLPVALIARPTHDSAGKGAVMPMLRTRKEWGLLFHASLFSMPCAGLGVLGSLVLLWGSLHGGNQAFQAFLVAGAAWLLLSTIVPVCVIVVFTSWGKAVPAGPRGGLRLLDVLVVLSAVQGIPALAMVGRDLSEDPVFLLLTVLLGAPWLTLACHMRWRAERLGTA